MKEKISTIKNPLTVIAIFAGTAELSGTAILPFLESQNQQIYIWFLMLFPLILILLFFITLNWNHKVLYAPSDFSNEDNFVNILKKPSILEIIEANLKNDEDEDPEIEDSNSQKDREKLTRKRKIFSDTVIEIGTKEDRKKSNELIGQLNQQRLREAHMAELMVLQKLEQELKALVQREMKLEVDGTRYIFDGVILKDSKFIGIEVKYFRHRHTLNTSMWDSLKYRFEKIYNHLSKSEQRAFSIIFAVVTDEPSEELKPFIENKLSGLDFPIELRFYDFDTLRNQLKFE